MSCPRVKGLCKSQASGLLTANQSNHLKQQKLQPHSISCLGQGDLRHLSPQALISCSAKGEQ